MAREQGGFGGCTSFPLLLCGSTTRQLQVALLRVARSGAARAERAKAIRCETRGDENSHVAEGESITYLGEQDYRLEPRLGACRCPPPCLTCVVFV